MNAKYAITGHTDGIGQCLFSKIHSTGFSRTNGYDISTKDGRQRIINESANCNIFVNNACSNFHQVDMLYEIFDSWKDSNKIIINIGSNTTDGIKSYVHPYAAHKAALHKASEQLSNMKTVCKVTNIKFGWIGTERVIEKFNPSKYILVNDAAEFIISQVEWLKKYRMTESTLMP